MISLRLPAYFFSEVGKMPSVGLSLERRCLAQALRRTAGVRCLICFACGQVHLDSQHEYNNDITLSSDNSKLITSIRRGANPEALVYNFDLEFFRESYERGAAQNPWRHDPECLTKDWEWRCRCPLGGFHTASHMVCVVCVFAYVCVYV